MSRLNSWKIVVVVSSAIAIAFQAYSVLTQFAYQRAIQGWITAMNSDDFISADSFADQMVSYEELFDLTSLPFLIAVGLIPFVVIIGWTHANAKLAEEIDSDALSHSTGWAIGSWLVPFMNFVRPRRILSESLNIRGFKSLNGLLNVWWVLFNLVEYLIYPVAQVFLESRGAELVDLASGDNVEATVAAMSNYSEAVSVSLLADLLSIAPLALVIMLVIKASKQVDDFSLVSHKPDFASDPDRYEALSESVAIPIVNAVVARDYKRCQFCAEEIRSEAIKCKHCGSDIS